ncbi:MAG: serine/threonine protein kinase [Myxococcales bacterium]|nr:serine/threonine protein kinase [Myxococcales bacterium]
MSTPAPDIAASGRAASGRPAGLADDACPDENAIVEFVEGDASAAARARLERHLDVCGSCHEIVVALLGREASDPAPARQPSGHEDTLLPELGSEPTLAASPPSSPWAAIPEDAPARLGRYLIIEVLGAGGMGVVYAAYDPELDRKVAVKVLRTGREGQEEKQRLLQEARAMARLSHANVVGVYDVGTFGDDVFVAMEFVAGVSLSKWQRSARRPWREVLAVYKQAARGLAAAHAVGLVHRDFKPQNAMVGGDGVVKVLDFGLARLADAPPSAELVDTDPNRVTPRDVRLLTRTGAVMGTPAYMSPEQFEGQRADARSDQFSFCVSLYHALYGEAPFAGDSFAALFHNVIHNKLRPADPRADVPAWLRAVVVRGLEVDVDARFSDMGALLEALEQDPARARRRRRAWAGVVGAIALTGLGTAALTRSWEQPCADVEDELATVWNAARQASTRAAMLASGAVFAEPTWARVKPALDEFTASWAELRAATCQAHGDGRVSERLYDRQTACLERRRASLDALVGALEDAPDAEVVSKAAAAARRLPSVALCADAEYLTSVVPHPEDVETARSVEGARRELARAAELESLGRYEEAVTIARATRASAEALPYAPLAAESLLREGSAQMMGFEARAADEALARAVWQGLKSDHGLVAAEAAVKRLYVQAELLRQLDEARRTQPLAESLVGRRDEPQLRSLYLNNVAIMEERSGRDESALRSYEAALSVLRDAMPPDHPDVAITLANMGALQTAIWSLDQGQQALESALERSVEALGPSHPQIALIESMLIYPLRLQGQLDAASQHGARAEAIQLAALGDASPSVFVTRREQGEVALEQGRYALARSQFERALEVAREAGMEGATLADATHGLARALIGGARESVNGEDVTLAMTLHERALESRLQAYDDDHHLVAESRVVLASALTQVAWPDGVSQARAHLEQARAIVENSERPLLVVEARLLAAEAELDRRALSLDAEERRLAQALELLVEEGVPEHALLLLDARLRYARSLATLGRHADALAEVDAVLARSRDPGRRVAALAARATLLAARDGCTAEVRQELPRRSRP